MRRRTIFAFNPIEVFEPMKEYVKSRFQVGSVVRNKHTNEDGKIDRVVIDDDCRVMYTVHIPNDSYGWEMGTKAVDVLWDEDEIETSPNQFLR
jgi:hypothetical protein